MFDVIKRHFQVQVDNTVQLCLITDIFTIFVDRMALPLLSFCSLLNRDPKMIMFVPIAAIDYGLLSHL